MSIKKQTLKPTLFIHADGSSCMVATDRRHAKAQLTKRVGPRVVAGFDYIIVDYIRKRQLGQVVYKQAVCSTSHSRGYPIRWTGEDWVYSDNDEPLGTGSDDRPCVRCDEPPTPEGHDACLGTLPGVTSACCGHGVTEPIRMEGS